MFDSMSAIPSSSPCRNKASSGGLGDSRGCSWGSFTCARVQSSAPNGTYLSSDAFCIQHPECWENPRLVASGLQDFRAIVTMVLV